MNNYSMSSSRNT